MGVAFNKILNQQIKKYSNGEGLPDDLLPLFNSISESYDQYQKEQRLVERAMDLSSDELLDANLELKKINAEMDRFVYSTSHDLRAPLLSILGLLNIVEKENKQYDLKGYLKLLRDSVEKLDRFISDIIDYSRNARLELELKEVDMNHIIEESFKHLNYMPGCSSLLRLINVDVQDIFISDERRISVLMNNLISNAIKYQNPDVKDSFVNIEVEVDSDQVSIEIEDNGIGIEEKYLDRVFEMFYRASPEAKGSGLGLYIVQETLGKLKGSIEVESEYGKGTKFKVKLPNYLHHTEDV